MGNCGLALHKIYIKMYILVERREYKVNRNCIYIITFVSVNIMMIEIHQVFNRVIHRAEASFASYSQVYPHYPQAL